MGEQGQQGQVLGVEELKRLLPHRPPFLFVERLTDIVPFESANGHKAVGINEPYFTGHFPDYSVMPGVLIVEALAQTAGALVVHSMALSKTPLVFFMGIDKARFRKPVVPGDTLRLHVRALQNRGPVWKFEGKAFVGEALCAEGEFGAMIRSNDAG
ncbi:MAG TPA: 3-hydroxyacyl-ACP dehydratase FabZ [Rhizomicrobium sp.]